MRERMKLRDWLLGLLSMAALLFLFVVANTETLFNYIFDAIFKDNPTMITLAWMALSGFFGYLRGLDAAQKRKDNNK